MSDTTEQPAADPPAEQASTGPVGLIVLVGALAVLGWWSLPALAIVLALVVIIFLHEAGHYVTARLTGMKVTEFFIGFGPRIWSFRRGETEYGVKAIWAGAYVRIIGMNNLDEVEPGDEERTYRSKSYPRRVLVASAGSLVHFALAIVLLFGFLVVRGDPEVSEAIGWEITAVSEGSAAEALGLEPGDVVTSVDGVPIADTRDLAEVVAARPGETVAVSWQRGDQFLSGEATLARVSTEAGEVGRIGVAMGSIMAPLEPVPVLEAAPRAVSDFAGLVGESVSGVARFVQPANLADFLARVTTPPGQDPDPELSLESRPVSVVGIVQIGSDVADTDGWNAVYLLALFNVFIGIFNLLPLPPLDGGHIAVATYERVRSRGGRRYEVDYERLLPLVYGVFVVMVLFGLGALYLDLAHRLT